MSGPTPITATHRIVFPYTVLLLPHVHRLYLHAVTGGGTSGFNTSPRTGHGAVDVQAAMTAVWNNLLNIFDVTGASTVFGNAILEERSGTTWNPVYVESNSVQPTGSSTPIQAAMVQVSLKTVDFKRYNVVILEPDIAFPKKVTAVSALSTPDRHFVDFYAGTGTPTDTDAYAWSVSRGNAFVGSFLSWVTDTNERTRRERHLK